MDIRQSRGKPLDENKANVHTIQFDRFLDRHYERFLFYLVIQRREYS